jgi:phage terminase small subunit
MARPRRLPNGLTEQQEKFCRVYLVVMNADEAARQAGYTKRNDQNGYQIISANPKVKARIEELQREMYERLQLGADQILIGLARIAAFDPRKMYDKAGRPLMPHEWPDEVAFAIAGMDIEETKTVFAAGGQSATDPNTDPSDLQVQLMARQVRKVRATDRLGAYALLMRHKNMFKAEAETVGNAMSRGLAEIIHGIQDSNEGVSSLLGKKPKALPAATGDVSGLLKKH